MRFVDLFAGLGGFHVALEGLGHQCVFASEIDSSLASLYKLNFGLEVSGDIRTCHASVPDHDVLCAGFPCQPFSKAGGQLGFDCPDDGDLFSYVLKVLDRVRPSYAMIENVPNILNHDRKETIKAIKDALSRLDYDVEVVRLSPHQIGIPQKRDRVFILASQFGFSQSFAHPPGCQVQDLKDLIDHNPEGCRRVSDRHGEYLDHWQRFLDLIPGKANITAFPIWAMEFGATYPFRGIAPAAIKRDRLKRYRGSFGAKLRTVGDPVAALPPYARQGAGVFPEWKKSFIEQNRAFYREHREALNGWLAKTKTFPASFQKFEWNWKDGPRSLNDGLIQFRASGIRVRSPECSSSLVAINASQVPIVGWERRYLTWKEGARLQSLDSLKHAPSTTGKAAGALGNAVNAQVVAFLAERLFGHAEAEALRA